MLFGANLSVRKRSAEERKGLKEMKTEIGMISEKYTIRQFQEEDIPDIMALCLGNPDYYHYMNMQPTPENIKEVFTALPDGKTMEDKFFLGFYLKDRLIALLDLITCYPDRDTAFIGWFMVEKKVQKKGVGTEIISSLLTFLQREDFRFVRLAYVEGNRESEGFWKRHRFCPTGVRMENDGYTAVVMQRSLIPVEKLNICNIPAIVWGEKSDKVYLFVHGKMSSKESAEAFAQIAAEKGYQTVSFDLASHGERIGENERCDIWNGMRDLAIAGDYVFANWKEVSLFGCSLGAYFCLHTYRTGNFKKCLFQSPIVDMEYLIRQMMEWFDVPEERLAKEKEVETPIDILSWDYYQYVKTHPIRKWDIPTRILFGGKDNLQSLTVMRTFAEKFDCLLTVAEDSEHSFMEKRDGVIVEEWLRENI